MNDVWDNKKKGSVLEAKRLLKLSSDYIDQGLLAAASIEAEYAMKEIEKLRKSLRGYYPE